MRRLPVLTLGIVASLTAIHATLVLLDQLESAAWHLGITRDGQVGFREALEILIIALGVKLHGRDADELGAGF